MCSNRTEKTGPGDEQADTDSGAETGQATPNTFPRDEVAADLRELLRKVEAIHPEPYHGYDGRVDLHATVEQAVATLPEEPSLEQSYRTAAELVAGLDDAHSRVAPPDTDDEGPERLPIGLRVVGDSLFVNAVDDESLAALLGAELLTVEGVSIEAIASRCTTLRGAENRYFARVLAGNRIEDPRWYDRLLDVSKTPSSVTLTVRQPDGSAETCSVQPVCSDSPAQRLSTGDLGPSGTGPRFDTVDDGRTVVFVPGNLGLYREVVQAARERNPDRAAQIAAQASQYHFGEAPPDSDEEAVEAIPSMVETVIEMVETMRAADTDSLVVDLSGNTGGDSRFVQYLCYAIYGWERLVDAHDWPVTAKRRTQPHREEYGVPERANDGYATHEENPAAYDFGDRFRTRAQTVQERVATYREELGVGPFLPELETEEHERYYTPDTVVVVTDATTLSSAFGGAALLAELGADVVGVPPGQAPLSFGEAVEVTLSNTGLQVDISGAMFRWTRDPSGPVLPMDRELTPELFVDRYDRAGDAPLRLGIDHARGADLS